MTINYYTNASRAQKGSARVCVSDATYAHIYRNKLLSFSTFNRHAPCFSAACHPLVVSPIDRSMPRDAEDNRDHTWHFILNANRFSRLLISSALLYREIYYYLAYISLETHKNAEVTRGLPALIKIRKEPFYAVFSMLSRNLCITKHRNSANAGSSYPEPIGN